MSLLQPNLKFIAMQVIEILVTYAKASAKSRCYKERFSPFPSIADPDQTNKLMIDPEHKERDIKKGAMTTATPLLRAHNMPVDRHVCGQIHHGSAIEESSMHVNPCVGGLVVECAYSVVLEDWPVL